MLRFLAGCERGEGDLGDFSVTRLCFRAFVIDRVGVFNRGLITVGERSDRSFDGRVRVGGNRDISTGCDGRTDRGVTMKSRVSAEKQARFFGSAKPLGGSEGITDQAGAAAVIRRQRAGVVGW